MTKVGLVFRRIMNRIKCSFCHFIKIIILIGKLWIYEFVNFFPPETTAERKARKTLVENLRMMFLLLICMAQWRPANRTNSAVAPTCTREHTPAILRYTKLKTRVYKFFKTSLLGEIGAII